SDANFELARRWLRECLSSHPLCGATSASPLPTRLIDIGNDISLQTLRLCTPAAGASGRYAALSYCWGIAQNNILTKTNLKDKTENIPLSDLPKTIRDAVEITQKLGLQYLWIDALCIIQDSVKDWETESANMGNIYNNAFFTIQASGAKDTKSGCFIPRARQELRPAKLRFESVEDGSLGSVFVRSHPLVNIKMEPLHQRGWTLQESLLSPRILSYGSNEMRWECKTTNCSEAGSLLQENQGSFLGLPKPIRTNTKNHLLPVDLDTSDPAMERKLTWSYIVRDYASRRLTYAKDKLPALSGLARYISHTRPGDSYLAGLWKSELPSNLLWGVLKGVRPSIYRAPSWSWAALDGEITVFSSIYTSTAYSCEVLNASTTLSGVDLFGQVSAGMITLRGQLKEGWRILDEQSLNGDPNVQYFYKHNRHLEPSDNTFRLKLGLCEVDIFDSAQKLWEPISTWCLRVTNLEGLALQQAPNGSFNRIGLFCLDDEKSGWFEESDVRILDIV
ncbi:HET-domain-containing protein, partial [Stipitochalara longipes BDJ]